MFTAELALLANLLIKQNDRGTFLLKGLIGRGAIFLRRYTTMDRRERESSQVRMVFLLTRREKKSGMA